MEKMIAQINGIVNNFVWGIPMLVLLVPSMWKKA